MNRWFVIIGVLLVFLNVASAQAQESATTTVLVFVAQCTDGLDNDGDLLIDYPSDLGCDGPGDNDETDPVYVCSDSIDNDGDGKIDYPDDPGCDNTTDQTEENIEPTPLSAGGGTIVGLIDLFNAFIDEPTVSNPIVPTPALPLYTPDVAISLDPNTIFLGEGAGPTGPTRSYFGQVKDKEGLVLEGVLVQLFAKHADGTQAPIQSRQGGLLAGITNVDGFFRLDPVPKGNYILVASKVGFSDLMVDVSAVTERLSLVLERNIFESALCVLPFTDALCVQTVSWTDPSSQRSVSIWGGASFSLLSLALVVSILALLLAFFIRKT